MGNWGSPPWTTKTYFDEVGGACEQLRKGSRREPRHELDPDRRPIATGIVPKGL